MFYGWVHPYFALLLLGVSLGMLEVFKYLGFFLENVNAVLKALGLTGFTTVISLALPLGIGFFFSGLWHGASWNFVIWGFYHGALMILERLWRGLAAPQAARGARGPWSRLRSPSPSRWWPLADYSSVRPTRAGLSTVCG